jgi:hypothetical protein
MTVMIKLRSLPTQFFQLLCFPFGIPQDFFHYFANRKICFTLHTYGVEHITPNLWNCIFLPWTFKTGLITPESGMALAIVTVVVFFFPFRYFGWICKKIIVNYIKIIKWKIQFCWTHMSRSIQWIYDIICFRTFFYNYELIIEKHRFKATSKQMF